ncbi:MAG TPA: hypothetical protein VF669_00995 [Tepidisphaeraceae bacterium]|jgi:flagellar motility protein MotE (MotC chaperone)
MKRSGIQILLIGVTVLALSAGVVAGMLASRLPAGGHDAPPLSPGALADELELNGQQREQMRQIWEPVRGKIQACYTKADELQRRRDHRILALLNDQQKAQFEKISQEFADQYADLETKREQTFQSAVERTKAILNESQRAKYDTILRDRFPHSPTTRSRGSDGSDTQRRS